LGRSQSRSGRNVLGSFGLEPVRRCLERSRIEQSHCPSSCLLYIPSSRSFAMILSDPERDRVTVGRDDICELRLIRIRNTGKVFDPPDARILVETFQISARQNINSDRSRKTSTKAGASLGPLGRARRACIFIWRVAKGNRDQTCFDNVLANQQMRRMLGRDTSSRSRALRKMSPNRSRHPGFRPEPLLRSLVRHRHDSVLVPAPLRP